MKIILGGVTAPKGFKAGGIYCGVKYRRKKDLALIHSERLANAAAVFTTNKVQAAPVKVSKRQLKGGRLRAIVANSGNANCCTGRQGMASAWKMVQATAEHLNISNEAEVAVCSTGIIGRQLPERNILEGIRKLAKKISVRGYNAAAEAILTTDTKIKQIAVAIQLGGRTVTLGAMCKGSGMIYPDMATMLCFITTDANIETKWLKTALKSSAEKTYNRISVDGDRSTNDTVIIMANGLAGNRLIANYDSDYRAFKKALDFINLTLAKKIVEDGEGATKLIEIEVINASRGKDAQKVAQAVANSNLFKTAMYGENPNWGRIMAALGASGARLDDERVDIFINDRQATHNGGPGKAHMKQLIRAVKKKNIHILINLKMGKRSFKMWTCDLSNQYVDINV